MVFSLGENLGADYKLIGADGTTLTGGGEGGSIYRCRPDGTKLTRLATGFWNTFHLTFDAFGRLFAVDNDPDSRGPCRLLHIVPGGDYGYRYRNGRKGLHPFTAWNGELPGTLPMVAGTSEAPSGIVAYESLGLPEEYRGNLLVTSWGDHVVERFQLESKGASFQSKAQIVVRGEEDFRPVAIATAPDGTLYISDWVDKSYPVHGKGRIWRLRMKNPPAISPLRVSKVALRAPEELGNLLGHPRMEIGLAAGEALARKGIQGLEIICKAYQERKVSRIRVQALWAAAKTQHPRAADLYLLALKDIDAAVRGEAVRILGQEPFEISVSIIQRQIVEILQKDPSSFVRMQAILQLKGNGALPTVVPFLKDSDPFIAGAAIEILSKGGSIGHLTPHVDAAEPKLRLGVLTALRRSGNGQAKQAIPKFLADTDPAVRRAAIQWVGEERLHEFASLLQASASRAPVTRDVVEAFLATNQLLAGARSKPGEEISGEEYVLKMIQDPNQVPAFLAVGLRMIRPDYPALKVQLLRKFLQSNDMALRLEAARSLAMREDEPAQEILRDLAADLRADKSLRFLAIMGLGHSAARSPATQKVLLSLVVQREWQTEAIRSLRGAMAIAAVREAIESLWSKNYGRTVPNTGETQEMAAQILLAQGRHVPDNNKDTFEVIRKNVEPRPETEDQWQKLLSKPTDPKAGERVFFHSQGPRCYACHRVDGRGSTIGPDLSTIGQALKPEKLIESILNPSKEIAPQFTAWQIILRDGKVKTGMIVEEGPHSTITLADSQGKLEVIHRTLVEERRALPTSIMPEKLQDMMTLREFQDLISFLLERK